MKHKDARPGLRVVKVRRISRDTEASAALVEQDSRLSAFAGAQGFDVVGDVEDATVSGAVNLDRRPKLKKWLAEPYLSKWDVLLFTEQDRVTRDDLHWWGLVIWLKEKGKNVLLLDEPNFELDTSEGRMMAGFKAYSNTKYRESVAEKRRKQLDHHKRYNLWSGGQWPFGYRAERFQHEEDGKVVWRWRLVIDPYTGGLVRGAYDRMVNHSGWSLNRVARDWTERGVPTPRNYQILENAKAGREGVSTKANENMRWTHTMVREIFTRHTLMGVATENGKPRMKDGMPVRWADPILSRSEFDKLQKVIKANKRTKQHDDTEGPVTGIVYCWCGQPMHTNTVRYKKKLKNGMVRHHTYQYMRCKSITKGIPCEWRTTWPLRYFYGEITRAVLFPLMNVPIVKRTFIPGEDHTSEIETLEEALTNLTANFDKAPEGPVADAFIARMTQHADRIKELKALPSVPDHWETEETGESFGDKWFAAGEDAESLDDEWRARKALLLQLGYRFYVGGPRDAPFGRHFYPADFESRAVGIEGGQANAEWLADWMAEVAETQRTATPLDLAPLRPYSDYYGKNEETYTDVPA